MSDTKWLTYDEAAVALRISPESVRRLAQRRKWPRRPGNDGKVRLGVPAERIDAVVHAAGDTSKREMVFELATALSGALVVNYEEYDFRDSLIIDRIAQVAAMMEAHDWEFPSLIREVLRKATEAGRLIGTA